MSVPKSVLLTDERNPNWRSGIRQSRVWACFVSASALALPAFWEQLAYAKQLKKPIRAFALYGTAVPEDLALGSEDFTLFRVSTMQEMAQIITTL